VVQLVIRNLRRRVPLREAAKGSASSRFVSLLTHYRKYTWVNNRINHSPPIIPTSAQANGPHKASPWLASVSVCASPNTPPDEVPLVGVKNSSYKRVSATTPVPIEFTHLTLRCRLGVIDGRSDDQSCGDTKSRCHRCGIDPGIYPKRRCLLLFIELPNQNNSYGFSLYSL
jgi:hypothetical protein